MDVAIFLSVTFFYGHEYGYQKSSNKGIYGPTHFSIMPFYYSQLYFYLWFSSWRIQTQVQIIQLNMFSLVRNNIEAKHGDIGNNFSTWQVKAWESATDTEQVWSKTGLDESIFQRNKRKKNFKLYFYMLWEKRLWAQSTYLKEEAKKQV